MKSDDDTTFSVAIPDLSGKVSKTNPTAHKGINTIISVALLVLVAVGFIVAFQQIGTNLIGSVDQPVQGNIEVQEGGTSGSGTMELTVQSLSDNVDEARIRSPGAGEITSSGNFNGGGDSSFTPVQVGDTANIDSLETGDRVIVVARDNPDNTGTILEYEYNSGNN